jgi:hypothetical protein
LIDTKKGLNIAVVGWEIWGVLSLPISAGKGRIERCGHFLMSIRKKSAGCSRG